MLKKLKKIMKMQPERIAKSLITATTSERYFAAKGSNILLFGYGGYGGYSTPEDAIEESHDFVDRYALLLRRSYEDIEIKNLEEGTTAAEAQAQALDIIENNRNNVRTVDVSIGISKTFAGRPMYKIFTTYEHVAASADVTNILATVFEDGEVVYDLEELEKQSASSAQSIIFPTSKYTVAQARSWLSSHGKKSGKVDTTENYHRFRQFEPSSCKTTPKTISFGGSGIKAIICVKKAEEDVPKKKEEGSANHEWEVVIKSLDLSKGLVLGVVYEPDIIDTHGDHTSADEIEQAAHEFLPNAAMDKDHKTDVPDVKVVESYIKLCDCPINGEVVKKGAWILVSKIENQELKEAIARGEYTGYSLAGSAIKV